MDIAKTKALRCFFIFISLLLTVPSFSSSSSAAAELECDSRLKTFMIHAPLKQKPLAFASPWHWYASAISATTGLPLHQSMKRHGPLYTYNRVFHGFSARLTPCQVTSLLHSHGFSHAFEDKILHLHTTHTPAFLDLQPEVLHGIVSVDKLSRNVGNSFLKHSGYGGSVIVGVLDTGIWPERPSFYDHGYPPVHSRWKGACEEGTEFNSSMCNRKLIGARFFCKGYEADYGPVDESSEYRSPRDSEGHGSHTASTAAGNSVANASLFGYAYGVARGMAPRARIAMYKVCWEMGCYNSDILAGFDSAVSDGVDIISLSVGGSVVPFYEDSIAIGSFGAMENGVLVSCSAGNSGPYAGSVANVPPWVLTVGASTVDRSFPAAVVLGDGSSYTGSSLYDYKSSSSDWVEGKQLPLVYAGDVGLNGSSYSNLCISGTLDPELVTGKIVLCDRGSNGRVAKGSVVSNAGGVGMILGNSDESGDELISDSHIIPASLVTFKDSVSIKAYIAAAGENATATIYFNGTEIGIRPAPVMASFSSRGPNPLPAQILKPDLTGPGVNILAAYTGAVGPTGLSSDTRIVEFTIMSGTSMSCPHVSGLAALIKDAHPTWSPAAIKSALITTSSPIDNTGNTITDGINSETSTPFAFGAGHVHPVLALDPGLVYDLDVKDYVNFLCALGYEYRDLYTFTQGKYACSDPNFRVEDLNYPSFALVFSAGDTESVSVSRTVTNVGNSTCVYSVEVDAPEFVNVTVVPETLEFIEGTDTLTYTVTFQPSATSSGFSLSASTEPQHSFGSITWRDDVHAVRSPIVITITPVAVERSAEDFLHQVVEEFGHSFK